MTRDNDNQPEDSDNDLNEFARDPFKRTRAQQEDVDSLQDSLREDFDEDFDDDPYDEPERDTAYPPAYREDDDEAGEDDYEGLQPSLHTADATRDDAYDEDEDEYLDEEADEEQDDDNRWQPHRIAAADPEQWLDESAYNDGRNTEETDYAQRLPIGLLIVAVVAVILLIAGGYGVMQDRAEAKAEIDRLRADLATAASSDELEEARAEAEDLRTQNNALEDRLYDLEIENRKLSDLVAGLEAQVEAVNPAPAAKTSTGAPPPAAPEPAPAPAPTPQKKAPAAASPAAAITAGSWFVNFGSYGQLSAAQAWQARLQPAAGDVITAASERDGRTFYRVRVVNLPDKATAEKVARALESEYQLSRLWVGQQ